MGEAVEITQHQHQPDGDPNLTQTCQRPLPVVQVSHEGNCGGVGQKPFESGLFPQEVPKEKKTSSGKQALATEGHPGRPNGSRRKKKPGKVPDPGRGGVGDHGEISRRLIAEWPIGSCDDDAMPHLSGDDNISAERLDGQALRQV